MISFAPRDCFAATAAMPSELVWETGGSDTRPAATVAIPTFRRFDTLLEAIASARAQTGIVAPDIAIVDNEGHGPKPDAVRAAIGEGGGSRVRYYVNPHNLGMFGNWNRCIELAETDWLTILNDDDLLRPAFLSRTLRALGEQGKADGIVCRKGVRDRRTSPPANATAPPPSRRVRSGIGLLLHRAAFRNGIMRVSPRRLFFGNAVGNGAGFLFRREAALSLGGYDSQEWPSADYQFYVRMAATGGLLWLDEELADVGIGDNESMAPDVLMRFVTQLHETRLAMAGTLVPSRWRALSPLIAANHVLATEQVWGVLLDRVDVARALDTTLPPPDPRREKLAQLWRGVF